MARGDQSRFEQILTLIQDLLVELRAEYERVRRESVTDPLTGLANRRAFEERLEVEVSRARRYGHDLTLVLMDIDHFKRYNDVHGHRAGDQVLRHLGWLIGREIREPDLIARYGGEEFALLLPETDLEGARHLIDRLRRRIMHDDRIPVTLSYGLAAYPHHAETAEDLLQVADQALYRAKASGRDAICEAGAASEPGSPEPEEKPEEPTAVSAPASDRGSRAGSGLDVEGQPVAVGIHVNDGRPVTLWRGTRVIRILEAVQEDGGDGGDRAFHIRTEEGDFRLVKRGNRWYLQGFEAER